MFLKLLCTAGNAFVPSGRTSGKVHMTAPRNGRKLNSPEDRAEGSNIDGFSAGYLGQILARKNGLFANDDSRPLNPSDVLNIYLPLSILVPIYDARRFFGGSGRRSGFSMLNIAYDCPKMREELHVNDFVAVVYCPTTYIKDGEHRYGYNILAAILLGRGD